MAWGLFAPLFRREICGFDDLAKSFCAALFEVAAEWWVGLRNLWTWTGFGSCSGGPQSAELAPSLQTTAGTKRFHSGLTLKATLALSGVLFLDVSLSYFLNFDYWGLDLAVICLISGRGQILNFTHACFRAKLLSQPCFRIFVQVLCWIRLLGPQLL